MLLRNDYNPQTHEPKFTLVSETVGKDLLSALGMVTDAVWTDIDKDSWPDLLVVGEWMPITIFRNNQGKSFSNISEEKGLTHTDGWWCRIQPADVDKDGDIDFILGNMGNNTQFKTNEKEPLVTYA